MYAWNTKNLRDLMMGCVSPVPQRPWQGGKAGEKPLPLYWGSSVPLDEALHLGFQLGSAHRGTIRVLEHIKGLGNGREKCLMPADNEVTNSQGCSLQGHTFSCAIKAFFSLILSGRQQMSLDTERRRKGLASWGVQTS